MKEKLPLGFIFLFILMIFASCAQTPVADTEAPLESAKTSHPAASPSPTPVPTAPPVQIILPTEIDIRSGLFYGMDRKSVIDIMGTPYVEGHPETTLSPEQQATATELYPNFLTYRTKFNGYEDDVYLVFQFYHYSGKFIDKFYGLERVLIDYKAPEEQRTKFLSDARGVFVSLYGEPSYKVDDYVTWDGDDEKGYPDVEFSAWGDYAQIKCAKHVAYKEIAEKEEEDSYFKTIKSGVTLANYNMIEDGMDYDTVIRYLGYGEKSGESKIGGDTYTYYEWYGKNAAIHIQFKNNKVSIINLTGNLY